MLEAKMALLTWLGLGPGWIQVPQRSQKEREHLSTNQPNTMDIEDGEDSEGPHRPGEFNQDESEELLWKVKASKSSDRQVRVSAGSSSGSRPTVTTPAIGQWGGVPLVARRTEQVCVELLGPVHDC